MVERVPARTEEELTAAIMEPSTNVIGVRADGDGLKTAIAGDELDIFQQAAATLPVLPGQPETDARRHEGGQAPKEKAYHNLLQNMAAGAPLQSRPVPARL